MQSKHRYIVVQEVGGVWGIVDTDLSVAPEQRFAGFAGFFRSGFVPAVRGAARLNSGQGVRSGYMWRPFKGRWSTLKTLRAIGMSR